MAIKILKNYKICRGFILADIFGRIFAISFIEIFALIGGTLCAFSMMRNSPWWIILGKFFIGIHNGAGLVLAIVSLSEISTFNQRGTLICVHQLAICSGMITSSLLSFESLFGNEDSWPYLTIVQFFPAFFILIGKFLNKSN